MQEKDILHDLDHNVCCIDAEASNGLLKFGEIYKIDRQTTEGYVWIVGIKAPFIPSRFITAKDD